jgi:lysozyme family protein
MALTYNDMKAGYGNMWRSMTVKGGQDSIDANSFARKIIAGEQRYRAVEAQVGVPWFFIGALHMRESGCDFNGVLHNGEHIIGTGKKTSLVPAGRGPFNSWEESAIDALMMKDLDKIEEWPIERMGFESERYNGFGYVNKGVNSPYVWAGSNHEQKGKYVADGKFDPNAEDRQIGTMTVLRELANLRPDIKQAIMPEAVPTPVPEPVKEIEVAHVIASIAVFCDTLAKSYPGANVNDAVDAFLAKLAEHSTMPKLRRKGSPMKPPEV